MRTGSSLSSVEVTWQKREVECKVHHLEGLRGIEFENRYLSSLKALYLGKNRKKRNFNVADSSENVEKAEDGFHCFQSPFNWFSGTDILDGPLPYNERISSPTHGGEEYEV